MVFCVLLHGASISKETRQIEFSAFFQGPWSASKPCQDCCQMSTLYSLEDIRVACEKSHQTLLAIHGKVYDVSHFLFDVHRLTLLISILEGKRCSGSMPGQTHLMPLKRLGIQRAPVTCSMNFMWGSLWLLDQRHTPPSNNRSKLSSRHGLLNLGTTSNL